MKKRFTCISKNWARLGLFSAFAVASFNVQAQAPNIAWDKSYGGSAEDRLHALQQTADGGYIFGGYSESGISGDKSQASKGGADFWVVKTDANGLKTWEKAFGGSGNDQIFSLQQTSDGGYIVGGYSDSPISTDKSQASKGLFDFWVIKLDASGNKIWEKTIGGSDDDKLNSLQQTADGGYILGGTSKSGISGDKSQATNGVEDYWVVKLNSTGNITWDKTFGGSGVDLFSTLHQTTDGGYILGGTSDSGISGSKTVASKGLTDYWVLKIDGNGTKLWDKSFGGTLDDKIYYVQQTADGGYMLGGASKSGISGDKSQASHGGNDFWIVKLDASGTKTWDKGYGGTNEDVLRAMKQTSDGGYLLGGHSNSGASGDKSQPNKTNTPGTGNDYWVVKVDAAGVKTWDKTLGGTGADLMLAVGQSSNGGYIVGGLSDSGIGTGSDKTQASQGLRDYWVVKFDPSASTLANDAGITAIVAPNSGCVLTNQETITVTVKNFGTAALSNIPVSYKINGGTAVNEVLAGPLAPNAFVNYSFTTKANLSTLGNYVIEALTNLVGDLAPINDAFTNTIVLSAPPAVATISPNTPASICTGGTVNLTASSATAGATFQWFNNGVAIAGATGSNYSPTASGSYTVTALSNGCAGAASAAVTVTVNSMPSAPSINNTTSLSFCSGDSVALTAVSAASGASFSWFLNGNLISGATAATYMAKTAGSYTAVASVNGCSSPASLARTVTVKQTPTAPTITQNGNLLTSSSSSGNQWFKNGTAITGATAQSLNATSNGSYTVKVTTNGCSSAASNAVSIVNAGMAEDLAALAVNVYPNPSNGIFNLELPQGKAFELTVTDLAGKIVLQQKVNSQTALLDLQEAAKGIYLLQLVSEGKVGTRKLIIE